MTRLRMSLTLETNPDEIISPGIYKILEENDWGFRVETSHGERWIPKNMCSNVE